MRAVKFLSVTIALMLVCVATHAQSGNRLNNAVRNAVENATVRQALYVV